MVVLKPNFFKVEEVKFVENEKNSSICFLVIQLLMLSEVTFDLRQANSSILLNHMRELFISYVFI